MITYCIYSGLKLSSTEEFNNLHVQTIHPIFSMSLLEIESLIRKKLSGMGRTEEKVSRSEAHVLALYPIVYMDKLVSRNGLTSECYESLLKSAYSNFFVTRKIIKGLASLNERQLKSLSADMPKLIISEISARSLKDWLDEVSIAIDCMKFYVEGDFDESLSYSINDKTLQMLENSDAVNKFLVEAPMEVHHTSLEELYEDAPETFSSLSLEDSISLFSATTQIEELAPKIEIISTLQVSIASVAAQRGIRAVRQLALIDYLNKLVYKIKDYNLNKLSNTYGKEYVKDNKLVATSTYELNGMKVKMVKVEEYTEVEDLDFSTTTTTSTNATQSTSTSDALAKLRLKLAALKAK